MAAPRRVVRRRRAPQDGCPAPWHQWAAPSALPLSTKLGTAVAGVVKDCVDPAARPVRRPTESQKPSRPAGADHGQDPHASGTGAPTGPRRAVERSIYGTLAPLAPGTHEPVSQEGGQPNVQSEACATRLSTVRRARHREAAPRDAVAAPARSLARDPAQKGSQTSAGKWAAATNQPETPRPHTVNRIVCLNYQT